MKITGFKGIKPRTSSRLLEDTSAQVASNVNLTSGEARPLSIPKLTYTPLVQGQQLVSIYRADDLWFTWARDVDVCRSPLPGIIRWIYSGDDEPRITTADLADTGGGNNYPTVARVLGVPKPNTAPTVAASGGTGTAVTRYYAYTFYDDWNQESAASPVSARVTGKVDDTWAISGMDAAPPNSGDITAITYTGTSVTITTSSAHFNRVGERIKVADVTTVTNVNSTGNGWVLTAVDFAAKTMTFTVTTAPTGTYANATDTTDTWTRDASHGTCTKRLYRTSGTTAQFQLVATGITATSYDDTILDVNIPGDELITAAWEMPPVDLKGVMTLPSGALCGFSGNEICFSEPFQPHAWPKSYRKRSNYPVVAVGLFSSGIVVGTTGTPLVILGHEPGQMGAQPATGAYPCLSKRSMVSIGDSVCYATAHGYARIGDNGVNLLTVGEYTRDDWDNLKPATMIAETVRGRIYIMCRGADPKILIYDYLDGTGLTTSDLDATELYADQLSGKLYVSDSVNKDIREFDPNDGVYMAQDWMSKEFVLPQPINLGAARVNFKSRWSQAQYDTLLAEYNAEVSKNNTLLTSGRTVEGIELGVGDVGGELNGDEFNLYTVNDSQIQVVVSPDLEAPGVTFTLYVDGVEKFSKTVVTNKGFTMPSGYKCDTFAVRVQGQSLVKSIDLAQTLQGLKNA